MLIVPPEDVGAMIAQGCAGPVSGRKGSRFAILMALRMMPIGYYSAQPRFTLMQNCVGTFCSKERMKNWMPLFYDVFD